ncbi:hypothetical protein [Yoonia sp.]|uniref:hypothetical protein n=1 Tax=Yoonia sp. TaxID=2212373 RepID=UPI00391CFA9D
MKIMTFVIGTIAVTSAAVSFGWYVGMSAGMLVLMALAALFIGQIMYLVMLVGMAWLSARREKAAERERNPSRSDADHAASDKRTPKTAAGPPYDPKR